MKTKSVFFLIIFTVSIFSTIGVSQEKFTFGIKGGIGFWRITSLEKSLNISQPIIYSYPIGYTLGFYCENKLSKHFSITGELLYQNSIVMVTVSTGYEGILEQKITTKYLAVPIFMKFKTIQLWNIYIFAGPSFNYLVNADYHFYDQIYHEGGDENITKNLPSINIAIEFGLGKEIEILKSNFSLELRAQLGLTRFQYYEIFYNPVIGSWKNYGLIFLMGYKFN